ncbi:hypothetical protein BgiMline_015430 [Biomphalaria glabrata]
MENYKVLSRIVPSKKSSVTAQDSIWEFWVYILSSKRENANILCPSFLVQSIKSQDKAQSQITECKGEANVCSIREALHLYSKYNYVAAGQTIASPPDMSQSKMKDIHGGMRLTMMARESVIGQR